MTKDEILAASDEQLNGWCASVVMGWERKHNQFSSPPDWWAVSGFGIMPVEQYAPTDNIKQATTLLDHLIQKQYFSSIYSIPSHLHRVSVCKQGEWGWYTGSCEDASRSRAIVVACLLALANMEELEQQQTAGGDAAQEGGG